MRGAFRSLLICAIPFLLAALADTHAQANEMDHMHPGDVGQPTLSEREHVPPDPPGTAMPEMPYQEMTRLMAMDDTGALGMVLLDRLDWRQTNGVSTVAWDAQGWYGNDYNKLWIKAEGERRGGSTQDARIEALWDSLLSRWWNLQAGMRHDFGEGPTRTWAAVGVQGLAPYFFDVEATAYVGDSGRMAARLLAERDVLFTQRLILQPQAELNLYGKSDPARGIGSGLSDLQVALRLRYEIRREFAPYLGFVWTRRFGGSATFARASGEDPSELQALLGLRVWF